MAPAAGAAGVVVQDLCQIGFGEAAMYCGMAQGPVDLGRVEQLRQARPAQSDDPRGRNEVRQYPRRRRAPLHQPATGQQEPAATVGAGRSKRRGPLIGTAFVHTVIDDHSSVAYAEIRDDETAATAVEVLKRAVSWFAARSITVERVLSDNCSAYKSHLWRDTCRDLGIKVKKTRPYRPQTNGKIERFYRTMRKANHRPSALDGPRGMAA